MNSKLLILAIFSLTALPVNADSLDSGKVTVRGKIFAPLSISSIPEQDSRASGSIGSDSVSTVASRRPIFFDCDSKNCQSINIKGAPNSFYSLSFLEKAGEEVSCNTPGDSLGLSRALNKDGKGSHLCAIEKSQSQGSDMTIVLTYD